jgi:hypothetical protein
MGARGFCARTVHNPGLRVVLALLCLTVLAGQAAADARDQARRMHDRLAGIPPSNQVLNLMEADIIAGNPLAAADRAMNNSSFYTVTLKNFATPWSNRDRDVFEELNDYTATVIGMVRDDVPFNTLLSANLVYIGDPNLGLPPYSMTNNNHYIALEQQAIDLRVNLVARAQTAVTNIPSAGIAGVMTTRGAAEAFFILGTNRAMFRFTMLNHMCHDMEQVKDTTRVPDRIRQDISRSPGGDSRIYQNNCIGCHAGMDPLAQAYAFHNFDEVAGQLVYTPGQVQSKYSINSDNFKFGYITQDDGWDNYWRNGPNQLLGWDSSLPGSGNGAASMGQELANSDAFARCQVKKAFRAVCFRDPVDQTDRNQIDTIVSSFKNGYRMKQVFGEAAAYCRGS